MVENVLLITYSIYDFNGRTKELVEALRLLGNVYVISQSIDDEPKFPNHIVYNTPIKSYIDFIRFCYVKSKKIKNLSIILADDRKGLIPAYLIKKTRPNAVSIYDSRELYIQKEVKHLVGKIGCIIESILNKKFQIVICANKERARIMKMVYKLDSMPLVFENLRKLEYSNKFDVDIYNQKYSSLLLDKKVKIISTSGLAFDRGGKKLIEDVAKMSDKYSLYILGGGNSKEKKNFYKLIEEKKISNIYLIGKVNSDELKFFINKCDLGAVFYHSRDLNNKYCASGKVFEFLFEELPIICSDNIPLANYCNEYGVGISGKDYGESIHKVMSNISEIKRNIINTKKVFNIERNREKLADEIKDRII